MGYVQLLITIEIYVREKERGGSKRIFSVVQDIRQ